MTIEGDPLSKQRPRFNINKNGSVYTPRHTKEAEDTIGWRIKAAYRELFLDEFNQFGVRCFFFCKGYQRRDLDNMCKLIFDACTGIVWKDDSQVIELNSIVLRDSYKPRTELLIYSLGIPSNFKFCKICKKPIRKYKSTKSVFCSVQCTMIHQKTGWNMPCANCGKDEYKPKWKIGPGNKFYCSTTCLKEAKTDLLNCIECGVQFRRPKSLNRAGNKYCSIKCSADYWRKKRTKAAYGKCEDCGGSTSKRTYRKCFACSLTHKSRKFGNGNTEIIESNSIVKL